MISEVYDALKEAGASEDKARRAAEAVATYDNRLAKIDGDLGLLKWMVGVNVALSVAIIARLFLGFH
jgi:hypothetical protein